MYYHITIYGNTINDVINNQAVYINGKTLITSEINMLLKSNNKSIVFQNMKLNGFLVT